jgi:hypothetical protein
MITANLFDFNKAPVHEQRQAAQVAYLRDRRADVLVVQEFWHETRDPDDRRLAAAFAEFCEAVGMTGRLAYAASYCHIAVLWNSNSVELAGWQTYEKWPFHHALAVATLDVGDEKPWRVATTQLSPARPEPRATEAALVAMAGLGNPSMVTFLGADFNTPGSELAVPGQPGRFYDPEPYAGQKPGLAHQLYQVQWNEDPDAEPIVDRRATETLRRAGLVDVAWHLRSPWMPTTGHHPADPHGSRRIDGWRASAAGLDRVDSITVAETTHSDHREVELITT